MRNSVRFRILRDALHGLPPGMGALRRIASQAMVLVASVVLGGVALGQESDWNERITQMSFLQKRGADYRLGSGDLIEVSVFGVDKFTHTLRINSSGTISLPFVGTVEASGMTTAEVETHLKTLLEEADLIRDPQVAVFVKEYRSQPVFVLGAVRSPGQYMMTERLRLIDVIAMAGGLDLSKAAEEVLIRRAPEDDALPGAGGSAGTNSEDPEMIRINLKELLESGTVALNVPIQGGDVIQVPERVQELFYIIGEVNRPGAFSLPDDQELLLTQALAWAGGPQKTAKADSGILVRYDPQGNRQELAVRINRILRGQSPDFVVQPNDVIFIPGSNVRTLGYGFLGWLPRIATREAIIHGPLR